MFKDHKAEGGFRQVVGGCSSNTLGLSNMLSEVLESVASSRRNPYEVISSEDLLARVENANDKISNLMEENNAKNNTIDLPQEIDKIITDSDKIHTDYDKIQTENDKTPDISQNKEEIRLISDTIKIGQKREILMPKSEP